MINFQPIAVEHKREYEACLPADGVKCCEYSFTNLFLWGRQRIAFLYGNAAVFSQFDRKSVYLFPVGNGDMKKTLDAIGYTPRVSFREGIADVIDRRRERL